MKCLMMLNLVMMVSVLCFAQKKWDGGGNNNQWNNDQNWYPDGVPLPTDDVLLEHSLFAGSYTVELPSGNSLVEIRSLLINPVTFSITVLLPVTNTATTALSVTGAGDAISIGNTGILINASGASSGTPIQLIGSLKIMNGGKYIHQTPRGNAVLIDRLSTSPGTENGIFQFDVPGLAGYTVSLTSNNFGTLVFSAETAGGAKSYSGSGTGNLTIRGDLIIDQGTQLSTTLTSDILLSGSLRVDGRFNIIPVTTGSTGRSLKFLGKSASLSGSGQITMNANFRMFEISASASLSLQKDVSLSNPSNAFVNYGLLDVGSQFITGLGKFAQADLATLMIGSTAGIQLSGDSGNIQTGIREFSKKAGYYFKGLSAQRTGSALPDSISFLGVDNVNGLALTQRLYCNDSILLYNGVVRTSASALLLFSGKIIRSGFNNYGQQNAGWENSFIIGPMAIESVDTGKIIFPIGSENVFAPLTIHKTIPGKHLFECIYHNTSPPDTSCTPDLVSVSHREYWSVKTNNANFQGGLLSLSLRPQSYSDHLGFTLKPAVYSLQENPIKWTSTSGVPILTNGFGWMEMDTLITGFKDITVGFAIPEQPLAWRLIDFSATATENSVRIKWQVDEDNEKLMYTLEKSRNGSDFSGFDTITSEDRNLVRYEIMDHDPFPMRSYYKLCINSGNKKEYSPVRVVIMKFDRPQIFPNPATDYIRIYFPTISSKTELSIVNVSGLVVYKTFVNNVTCQVRVSNLRNGMYFVKLRHNNELLTLPFIKY